MFENSVVLLIVML